MTITLIYPAALFELQDIFASTGKCDLLLCYDYVTIKILILQNVGAVDRMQT